MMFILTLVYKNVRLQNVVDAAFKSFFDLHPIYFLIMQAEYE